MPSAVTVAVVWVNRIVTVCGSAIVADVRSAPGVPVPAAGGASVAVIVSVVPDGTTYAPDCNVTGADEVSMPLAIRKPQKLPAGAPEASKVASNHTLPAPSVSDVAELGLPVTGNTANPFAAVPYVKVCDCVSWKVVTVF